MTDLNGKVVLVTGSSRSIGAEIAVAFARDGAKVVLHGRDTEALAKVQADITNGSGHAMFVTGDVTNLFVAYLFTWLLWVPTLLDALPRGWALPSPDNYAQLAAEGFADNHHLLPALVFSVAVFGPIARGADLNRPRRGSQGVRDLEDGVLRRRGRACAPWGCRRHARRPGRGPTAWPARRGRCRRRPPPGAPRGWG
jgi:NAD(P)-dependent dehydrogenase (short-subunit alcohol dehydrogenase family)